MQGKVIALLESRLAEHVAGLIRRRGATPISAPALSEEPIVDPAAIARLIGDWSARPVKLAHSQTGVGTRALFAATDALGIKPTLLELLTDTIVAVRGPKPTAVLRGRQVRIDHSAAEPFTTVQVLEAIAAVELAGETVVIQRYGDVNAVLNDAIVARGANVVEVPTYRWTLPPDTTPLTRLIDALERTTVDAVVFTSASQVANLFVVADRNVRAAALRDALNATCVASVGPVCSHALRRHGVDVDIEASPPKLGPLLDALDAAF
ncbi:MAG TPA: uroporphyrinogen-III synthase [Pseudomonadales bacterium]